MFISQSPNYHTFAPEEHANQAEEWDDEAWGEHEAGDQVDAEDGERVFVAVDAQVDDAENELEQAEAERECVGKAVDEVGRARCLVVFIAWVLVSFHVWSNTYFKYVQVYLPSISSQNVSKANIEEINFGKNNLCVKYC